MEQLCTSFVFKNEHWDEALEKALMEPGYEGELTIHIDPKTEKVDMYDLLVRAGIFPSKGQARKNWKGPGPEIPPGFNEYVAGKLKRRLTIWNPVDDREAREKP